MIPCVGKIAIIGWKGLTADIMDDERHLASLRNMNVAIVNGEKSGGLCCIDVDDEEFGKVLLEKNPFLRDTTQTKGRRNCNYWVRFIDIYPSLYHLKFGGKKVGEFRSTGGYSVIAGKHPEEGSYTIPNKVFPIELGFKQLWLPNQPNNLNQADYTERTDEDRENGRGLVSGESKKGDLSEEFVVNRSLPTSPRQNHSCLFKLARGMKGLEAQSGTSLSPKKKEEMFDQWYQYNRFLREGQSWEDYYFELLASYDGVQFPLAQEDVLKSALENARSSTPPPETTHFEDKRMKLLASICRELQLMAGDRPFFISCRNAAALVGQISHKTASKWLVGFRRMSNPLLEVINRGGPHNNKATRYRYLGTLERHTVATPEATEMVR